jgi:endoglucanase
MDRRDVLRGLAAAGVVAWAGADAEAQSAALCGVRQIAAGVHLNQVGFLPGRGKRAAVVLATMPDAGVAPVGFRVVDAASGSVRLEGKLSAARMDAASGDVVAWADFSALKRTGTYRVEACGVKSDAFAVGDDVYRHALWLTTRAYYGQRCGCAVDLGGGYKHPACHLKGAYHPTSGRAGAMANTGGWHDAGDYGRYVVNSGISTGTLLWAWEMYPQALREMKLDIPESGNSANRVPDFLAEVRWNLQWMLSLQDADGGVWQKQTSEEFAPFVMPQVDALTSYVIGTGAAPYKSTAATADLASVAAIAARCYREFDAAFADRCLAAARKAWTWAMANPNVVFRNPRGIRTGEYGDRQVSDELLWASAELFRTTGEAEFETAFLAGVAASGTGELKVAAPSWNNVAPMAYWTYCFAAKADAKLRERIATATLDAARARILRAQENGYGNTLRVQEYHWGSNSVAGNDSLLLLVAHRFEPNAEAVETALGNLDYLVGCNCHGVSWVTQLGTRPFMHPHHRPSAADGIDAPWPGMLSGGPNAYGGDVVANAVPKQPPMKMWVDDQRAYSMNEIAINWNAPLVFLLAAANSAR